MRTNIAAIAVARTGRAQLLPASGAEAGETIPIDRPPRRRPRRACAGARRLLTDWELPEIAEAQALLDTLAKDDRVRDALGRQQTPDNGFRNGL